MPPFFRPAIAATASTHSCVEQAPRAALFAASFLFQFATGPSVNFWQLMAFWLCVAALALTGPTAKPDRVLLAWLAMTVTIVVLRYSPEAGTGLLLSTCVTIVASGMAACVGRIQGRVPIKTIQSGPIDVPPIVFATSGEPSRYASFARSMGGAVNSIPMAFPGANDWRISQLLIATDLFLERPGSQRRAKSWKFEVRFQ